jgi:hypothetical protein
MLTVPDTAKILDVSPRRIRALIISGKIKAKKMGSSWIVLDYSKALDRKPGNPRKRKSETFLKRSET